MKPYGVQPHCSGCKKPVKPNADKMVVARSAIEKFINIGVKHGCLLAYLCDDCEEKRQQYFESYHGYKRGDIILHSNGRDTRKLIIDYFFDEQYFVDRKGSCVSMSGILQNHRQSTLF